MARDTTTCAAFDPIEELGIREDELRQTIISEFLEQECIVLPDDPESFTGCGIYALYYYGEHPRYEPVSNDRQDPVVPIYIGTATADTALDSDRCLDISDGTSLAGRLAEHRESIEQVENLDISEFRQRALALPPMWIRYAQRILYRVYKPWWNCYIDGFDVSDVEVDQLDHCPVWDTLHPGRHWVDEQNLDTRGSPDDVWDAHVAPRIVSAQQGRTYKDYQNIKKSPVLGECAPAVEEASLFEFEQE